MENYFSCPRWKKVFIGLIITAMPVLWLSTPLGAHQTEVEFQRYTIEEGLSQNSVLAILKDTRGFMWFGTKDGLNQFDGYRFLHYNYDPSDSNSISDNAISCLAQNRDRQIWIGTFRGLNLFDAHTRAFTRYFNDPDDPASLSHNSITCLFVDSGGNLWAGTKNGLNKFDQKSGTFTHYLEEEVAPGAPDDIRFGSISAIGETGSGKILIGSRSQLISLNPKTGTYTYYSLKNPTIRVITIFRDNQGKTWIGVDRDDLMLEFREEGEPIPIRRSHPFLDNIHYPLVSSIIQDLQGRFWIATNGGGIWIVDLENRTFTNHHYIEGHTHSLSDNQVTRVYAEKNGVWVGTAGRGVNFWNAFERKFELITSSSKPVWLSSRSIRAIYEDKDGILWISGYRGFDRIDRKSESITTYHTSNNDTGLSSHLVLTICPDPDQPDRILWLGTETAGMNKFDKKTGKSIRYIAHPHQAGKLQGNQVNSIIADDTGFLWVATDKGLHRFDRGTETFHHIPLARGETFEDIPTNIRTIHDSNDGYLWLGTRFKGLIRFEKSTGRHVSFTHAPNDPSSISSNYIHTITGGNDKDLLWIGTNGGGLNLLNKTGATFQHYMIKHGLPNNTIYGILQDKQGRLWLSTNNGLSRFDPQTENFRNFSERDGLQSREFNRASYFKSPSGEMFFGGINGLNTFFPDHIHENPQIPPIAITDFQIFNRSVRDNVGKYPNIWKELTTEKSIHLSYKENIFTIEFASLNFIGTERNLYRYKLEGADRNWVESGTRRFVTYANVHPGNYTFWVTGSNNDQVWNREGIAIAIHIAPPYWLTLWFRLLAAAAAVFLIIGIFYIRTASIRRRNTELQNINDRLNQEILVRQRAEAEIQKLLRSIEQSPNLVAITDTNGNIEYGNQTLLENSGIDMQELQGKSMRTILSHRLSTREFARIWLHVKSGKQWRGEMPVRKKDGDVTWENVVISPILDDDGNIANVLVSKEDITAIKQLQQQVLQTQKMESVGNLAGGIAHDFNNIITIISGHAEMSLHKLEKDQSPEKSIDAIINAAHRAENLTRQLLAFSRKQIYDPIVLDVNRIITGLDKMLSHLISEEIRFQIDLETTIPPIKADPNQLEQILMNLIINARDAVMEKQYDTDDRRILIETRLVNLDATFTNKHFDASPGFHVLIAVTDNGAGMTDYQKSMIFEPFYSTKDQGKGTGLGLATVYGIVKQNRGSIYVYSEPNHGSTFKIYWPVCWEHLEEVTDQPESHKSLKGDESILLVEDDPDVLQFTSVALREFGYQVHEADCGKQAIQIVKDNNIHFDILVTDVVMPEMNGQELSHRIQQLQPGIRVLFTSGYTQNNHLTHNGAVKDGIQFIQKPYSIYGLTKKIRQIIDNQ